MASWLFAAALTLALALGLRRLDDHGEILLMALYCLNFIGTTLWIEFHRREGWRRKLAVTVCLLFLLLTILSAIFLPHI